MTTAETDLRGEVALCLMALLTWAEFHGGITPIIGGTVERFITAGKPADPGISRAINNTRRALAYHLEHGGRTPTKWPPIELPQFRAIRNSNEQRTERRHAMTSIDNTMKLGQMVAQLTTLMDKNPTAALRAGEAIARECGTMTTLSAADVQAQIMAMSNGRGAAATDDVARLTAEWSKVAPTLTPVQLASLRALEGDSPVRLMMRWNLIRDAKARGIDARIVGGIG
jgi:hypothetical protein